VVFRVVPARVEVLVQALEIARERAALRGRDAEDADRHDGALVLGREVAALRFSWTSGSGMVAGAAAPELVAPNAGAAVGTPNLSCYLGVYRLEGTRSHSLPRN